MPAAQLGRGPEEEVRLAAIATAYEADFLSAYHYKRMARSLYDVADEVGAYIVANGIEVATVVSPVGRAQRDHGDNQAAPVDELYEILRSFGTTNILIDHVTGDDVKGGAQREFGSVRKRDDNARGSYSLYAQSEDVGARVVVIKNTKPDAMAPKMPAQAIRIEYDPPEGRNGVYDTIRFFPDEVEVTVDDSVTERSDAPRLKESCSGPAREQDNDHRGAFQGGSGTGSHGQARALQVPRPVLGYGCRGQVGTASG